MFDDASRLGATVQAIGFFWENFGPTHFDRCEAVARSIPDVELVAVQWGSTSDTYGWAAERRTIDPVTLFPGKAGWQGSRLLAYYRLIKHLRRCRYVFLCHYNQTVVFFVAMTLWLLRCRVYAMVDSKYDDFQRYAWREFLKSLWLFPYHGVMVASRRSASFLAFLGVNPRRILLGYDTLSLDRIRRLAGVPPAPEGPSFEDRHFIIVARFVLKKNLENAILSYARYADMDPQPRRLKIFGCRATIRMRVSDNQDETCRRCRSAGRA